MMLDLGKRGVFDARGELLTGGKGNRNRGGRPASDPA